MDKTKNLLELWGKQHWKNVVLELREAGIAITPENIPVMVHEMSFAVRSVKHPERCTYFQMEPPRPCHASVKDLNCLLCACPHYRSESLVGGCKIGNKKGESIRHQNLPKGIVWDCSNCDYGHSPSEAGEFLKKNMLWLQDLDKTYKE